MMSAQWISVIANHLWQSTAVAAAVALLTILLRSNHAGMRYRLWLIASMKFLFPFALLMAAGAHLKLRGAAPLPVRGIPVLIERSTQPFPQRFVPAASAAPEHSTGFLIMLLASGWAAGFLIVLFQWWRQWRRIDVWVRAASPLVLDLDVPVLSSPWLLEPAAFGIFRPVLVLPQGLTDHLPPGHLRAILAHELCHIRRRDNLAGAMHMVVEAVFWFFPPVWWIGARLVEERERACDEEVLRLGNEPEVYAESILDTCRFCLQAPLTCVSGISGADLKKRILRITAPVVPGNPGWATKLILTTAGMAAILGPLAYGAFAALEKYAQSPAETAAALPSFEVATIKPNHRDSACCTWGGMEPGGYQIRNISLKSLIADAYELPENQVSGGPGWMGSEHYDIEARMSESQYHAIEKLNKRQQEHQTDLMLQSLLAARFGLTVNHQSEEFSGYALMVAKGGPKMHMTGTPEPPASKHPDSNGGSFLCAFQATDSPLHGLVVFLSNELDRPVIDETGLSGNYDINLAVPVDSETDLGSGIMAMLRDQLGLALKSRKVPADMIVVTNVGRPTEN
jgi:bla regulator protein blaR1